MQNQYINEWLNIPQLRVTQIVTDDPEELHFEAVPVDQHQSCPICLSDAPVVRRGTNGMRKIRHLPVFEKKSFLHVPAIRLYCKACEMGFVWAYEFVEPKQQYSKAFCSLAVEHALGSTATHSARMQQAPTSTVQRWHRDSLPEMSQQVQAAAWAEAEASSELVLGIDDFAIKKGHTYNTGIHNLRGETMLDLFPGRSLDDLRAYADAHPDFRRLSPKAIVMDLAQVYHIWIREYFPTAIRIADRFHVHGYVVKAVQEVRKTVQLTLSPRAKAYLKSHHRLLNPPADALNEESRNRLHTLLSFSPLLRAVWEWREAFTVWYDCSPNVAVAETSFDRWCKQGEQIDHPMVRHVLQTMRNWKEEIVNYHRCRWTNAMVEGRHNRIKAFQRRHYFTRNRDCYKDGILLECNRHRMLL
ncbi:MAG: ISL3 family transposase [Paenibacillaceae bacterium]|nr:ISL3 family transposase [Paenibacillaceae bacterium]